MDTIRDMIAAQRAELAEILAGLPGPSWDEPTLCEGWRVREIVAHITMPFRYGRGRFALELAKSRGRFDEMADRLARRDAAGMPPAELTGAVRSNIGHPWKPPGGGFTGALAHDLIHGLDITVPLGLARPVPEERLRLVLPDSLTDRSVRFFGTDRVTAEADAASHLPPQASRRTHIFHVGRARQERTMRLVMALASSPVADTIGATGRGRALGLRRLRHRGPG
jgi:uncharacterized protein (TIGR03083 family)